MILNILSAPEVEIGGASFTHRPWLNPVRWDNCVYLPNFFFGLFLTFIIYYSLLWEMDKSTGRMIEYQAIIVCLSLSVGFG